MTISENTNESLAIMWENLGYSSMMVSLHCCHFSDMFHLVVQKFPLSSQISNENCCIDGWVIVVAVPCCGFWLHGLLGLLPMGISFVGVTQWRFQSYGLFLLSFDGNVTIQEGCQHFVTILLIFSFGCRIISQ